VPAGARFLVSTKERVRLPDFLMGNLWLRTSWARKGVLASFGVVDAGFEGELTLAAFASGSVEVEIGKTFAQIVFFRLGRPAAETYARRSGVYQGQSGVTLARDGS
jgi:dCTP deaminase